MIEYFNMLICLLPAMANLFWCHHETNPLPNTEQETPADECLSYS
jgi:hypothetical protein